MEMSYYLRYESDVCPSVNTITVASGCSSEIYFKPIRGINPNEKNKQSISRYQRNEKEREREKESNREKEYRIGMFDCLITLKEVGPSVRFPIVDGSILMHNRIA